MQAVEGKRKKVVKEDEIVPKDERTITIPKRYLTKYKEGDIISFKYLLDDGDGVVLVPEIEKDKTPIEEKDELDKEIE